MKTFLQKKLWRDKLVQLAEKEESIVEWRILDNDEFDQELRKKAIEEVTEIFHASSQTALIEEIADLYEVVETIANLHQITKDEIKSVQQKKAEVRGGFHGRKFVETVRYHPGSQGEAWCRKSPKKYPEIKNNSEEIRINQQE